VTARIAAVAFASLACATVGAFFVAQRVKRAPPIVQGVLFGPHAFSPVASGVTHRRATLSFRLKRSDDVSVAIVDRRGDVVRQLVTSRFVRAGVRASFAWDGRSDAGALVPDGRYRALVGLRREGRSAVVRGQIALDATSPRPAIASVRPPIFPRRGFGAVKVHFRGPRVRRPTFFVYRTDAPDPATGRPRRVAAFAGAPGSAFATWDVRAADGTKLGPGVYLITVRVRDRAGNISDARPPRLDGSVRGHPGLTVRYVGVAPPLVPVTAGRRATFFVDSRKRPYDWAIRRVGSGRPLARGRVVPGDSAPRPLVVRAPRGPAGVYLLKVASGPHRTTVPFAVGTLATSRARPLVVLPTITWEGRNPVDEDRDGLPNTLDAVRPVSLLRPFATTGLPVGFADHEAPLLAFLDRAGLRYDLTTDFALARGVGPALDPGRRGVLIAGDARWLSRGLAQRLRRYVEAGGRVASLGTDSLRRGVRVGAQALSDPTAPAKTDLFGAGLEPVGACGTAPLVEYERRLDLFFGTGGQLSGYARCEETAALPSRGTVVSAAGPAVGRPVLLAYRLGKGLVIRTGLPQWSARLRTDPVAAQVMRRIWAQLSR